MSDHGRGTQHEAFECLCQRRGACAATRYAATKTPDQWLAAMIDQWNMIPLLKKRYGEVLGKLLRAHVMSKTPVILASYGTRAAQ